MATYKVIQNIEAEDHILGPLSLRQFIFALIACFLFYISFLVATKGTALLLIIFLPPAVFFGFFALPFGRDQPTEVWFLAKLRFWFLPRKRIWSQDGVKQLVTITAPKKVERVVTDGLSQAQVKSRLKALANTIDSRGWAVKNVGLESFASPVSIAASSDRLINVESMPQEVPNYDVTAVQDVLDENTSPLAQQFDAMITKSEQTRRQQLVSQLNSTSVPVPAAAQPAQAAAQVNNPVADYWFMSQASGPAAASTPSYVPAPEAGVETPDEKALAAQLKTQSLSTPTPYGHLRTLAPLGTQSAAPAAAPAAPPPQPVTDPTSGKPASDPAILSLANNDDLNVATLQREAKRTKQAGGENDEGEVVVPLR